MTDTYNFFAAHSWVTLIFLACFPRLTLLIASFATGGLLWWLGWIFCPHILVAVLATPHFSSHPVLVIFAWIIAIKGTFAEKNAVLRKNNN
jgi:hypothetical protein